MWNKTKNKLQLTGRASYWLIRPWTRFIDSIFHQSERGSCLRSTTDLIQGGEGSKSTLGQQHVPDLAHDKYGFIVGSNDDDDDDHNDDSIHSSFIIISNWDLLAVHLPGSIEQFLWIIMPVDEILMPVDEILIKTNTYKWIHNWKIHHPGPQGMTLDVINQLLADILITNPITDDNGMQVALPILWPRRLGPALWLSILPLIRIFEVLLCIGKNQLTLWSEWLLNYWAKQRIRHGLM